MIMYNWKNYWDKNFQEVETYLHVKYMRKQTQH